MSNNKKSSNIEEMINEFGYDYVIGFCLCSAYDVRTKAETEEDETRKKRLLNIADSYDKKAGSLLKERIENGL